MFVLLMYALDKVRKNVLEQLSRAIRITTSVTELHSTELCDKNHHRQMMHVAVHLFILSVFILPLRGLFSKLILGDAKTILI